MTAGAHREGVGRLAASAWPWLAPVALAWLTWPGWLLAPRAGLDPSWIAGLHLAAEERLRFGEEILFTYGPLGFLSVPVLTGAATASLALAFVAVTQVALCASLLAVTRSAFPVVVALVLTFLAASLPVQRSDVPLLVLVLLAVPALAGREPPGGRLFVPLAGAGVALQLLVKVNAGLVALAVVALAAWWLPPGRWRAEAVLATSAAGTFLLLWTATGNSLADLPAWLSGSAELVRGYSEAAALEQPGRRWEYVAFAALVFALASAAFRHGGGLPGARRTALLVLAAGVVFFYFKSGFVRHDAHAVLTFGALGIVALAFVRPSRPRWLPLAAFALAVATVLATREMSVRMLVRPADAVASAVGDVRAVAGPDTRRREQEQARAGILAQLELDGATLAAVRGVGVHVDPYQTVAVWAADLDWRPLPLFQSYAAWTAELDRRNASFAASERAPERILRERIPLRLDDSLPELEGPQTFLALVCNYVELRAGERWQVLEHAPGRCGPLRALGSRTVALGEPVSVPEGRPDELVVARFSIPRPAVYALRSLLHKPPPATLASGGAPAVRFRVATSAGLHVLRVPDAAGFARGFGGEIGHGSFVLHAVPSPFRVDFFGVAITPPASP